MPSLRKHGRAASPITPASTDEDGHGHVVLSVVEALRRRKDAAPLRLLDLRYFTGIIGWALGAGACLASVNSTPKAFPRRHLTKQGREALPSWNDRMSSEG